MEPNIKRVTVKNCASREEANGELIKGLLGNEPISLQMLVTILESEPYGLDTNQILQALNELNKEGLIAISGFTNSWMNNTHTDVILKLKEKS